MRSRVTPRGLGLTEIGLGAAQFGNLNRVTTDADSSAAGLAAIAAGIRYFDTAPHYGLGLSEQRLGAALRSERDVMVSTKVGRVLVDSPESAHLEDSQGFVVPAAKTRRWDFSERGIRESLAASLDRLGTDSVDIVYLHDPDDHWLAASTEAVPALKRLKEEGAIRAFGAGMNQAPMLTRFVNECDADLVMVAGRFTLLDQSALHSLLPACVERGAGVVVAGVYNSGLLSSPVVADGAHYDYAEAPSAMVQRARDIARLCDAHGVDLPSVALAYPLLHPAVTSVVVGIRTADHVHSTMARYATDVPDGLWDALTDRGLISVHPADFRTK